MSDETRSTPRPPKRIIAVVVLTYLAGFVDIVLGVLLVLARYDAEVRRDGEQLAVTLLGAALILIGLLTIAMASGLTRARNSARIFVTALMGLSLATSVLDLVRDTDAIWSTLVGAVVPIAVILVLWTGRGARFFREGRSARPVPSS
ncbi:hypothetical protein GCM10017608_03040 [Agromyces luteolus]|uniref:Uncharacterized protein n=1 Tax=Agromyces luteolus TaxID=88373 RepID=A0A7C9HFZ2_9MICO|nr:hypothetical protein [Agromyces luteolus]MUN05823.1 hypothetical protein [Agromyces luteolus]GLK26372.1 hypothetical protein GCM10017608_03040 [Agromyces luteolus]